MLIFCLGTTSYAYVIGTNLTIENKTDVPMLMLAEQPNGQANNTVYIPAHNTSHVYMENGDYSGLLYQMSNALFQIMGADDHKIYLQGRVSYYVGASVWNKYSFLDAVFAASGLEVDSVYTCKNGGANAVFENKIVIDGTPGSELQVKEFPAEMNCKGLKSSTMDTNGMQYYAICFDGERATYQQMEVHTHCGAFGNCEKDYTYRKSSDEKYVYLRFDRLTNVDDETLHTALDNKGGNAFCNTW